LSAPPYNDTLHKAETAFLEQELRACDMTLQDGLENAGEMSDAGDPTSEPALWLQDLYGQRRQILQELLASPQRRTHSLEHMLGDWLRWADQRLMEMARNAEIIGSYDPADWELAQQRALRTDILKQWWNWLHN
jgi:hypothetical protein